MANKSLQTHFFIYQCTKKIKLSSCIMKGFKGLVLEIEKKKINGIVSSLD